MTGERALAGIEVRYRGLLRAYPAEWRDRNGEALLGVLLDSAEARGQSAPTLREVLDLTARGLRVRLSSAGSVETRRRVASISAGMGMAYALVTFLLSLAPDSWGNRHPMPQPGSTAVLAAWMFLTVASLVRPRTRWRVVPLAAVTIVPVLLLEAPEVVGQGHYVVTSAWVNPNNGNAAFLFGLALLAMVSPIDRRLLVRTAVVAVLAFALGVLIAAGWRDPFDQTLWASNVQSSPGAPGTLQALWGAGSGRMPLAQDGGGQSFDYWFREWAQAGVLRLNLLPVGSAATAIVLGVVLIRRRLAVAGRTLIVLSVPFVAALAAAAMQPAAIWFQ